ncbi:NAD(P)H-dependent oxidoreductase [Photobacterium sp. WH77]|uniref:FMN dependent NADH:quinone oxidoreductase n=1 Tax=Photobacterium arenosum TaxID=2774143 RepID=A0ABR9BIL1_9GAMM|nr:MULTISPECIES: NAD(P)H-dependent oxidoreductase [Photobacterium]MBD8511535.1 NAD(P)H-dependent oxidoreductase [Photobacterium arenosum]MBV7264199.1 NAD(P)H-dependent oxidoreductase [Photobacterium sp. WH24]MCG2837530.1 NAD(P)H-dependent oxidoreductase [Photobacterium sp. WH77]MCG2845146.1 NAD(P)H-dependent oxidoreductase [Photobacterium sp. WH80]MDO6583152.1 NAD(P)H-dependent oxidoreductase [Photobacterium sp. 2_MG-2023]
MNLLHIKVSPNIDGSASRKVSDYLVDRLKKKYPGIDEKIIDLSQEPLPHLDACTVEAFLTKPDERKERQTKAVELSDRMIDNLFESDLIVISSPIWNLGLPSVLKAWFDHITRAGRTFKFTDAAGSKVGLVPNKTVYIVVASGSIFSYGPLVSHDQFTPYIKYAFQYIGITDLKFVRIDGTHDPLTSECAVPKAISLVDNMNI